MLAQLASLECTDDTTWQRFSVEYQYPVSFTNKLFHPENPTLLNTLTRLENTKQHRLMVIIDEGVARACPELIRTLRAYVDTHARHMTLSGEPMIVKSGEDIKSDPASIEAIQKEVARQHIDRHSFIAGIGGGALLDAVGLVAATSHRGIRHIRIPTTVLSQNDSGVGVKNGINLFGQKNYFGTFAPPFAVINDYAFIKALPVREKIAGMAEAVKVALIRDKHFYHWLESIALALARFDQAAMQYMIKRCAELHMHQIAQGGDPFETGSARPLDFGHWSAHRLELLTGHALRHGEAVAIGIALDVRYSVLCGLLKPGNDTRVCQLLESLGFTLWHPALVERSSNDTLQLLEGLEDFKEHLGGELSITLIDKIGSSTEVHQIDEELMAQSIAWLHRRQPEKPDKIRTIKTNLKIRQQARQRQITANTTAQLPVNSADTLNLDAVISHLQKWLKKRLCQKTFDWLTERIQLVQTTPSDRDFFITIGLIPRKLNRDDLNIDDRELLAAQTECGRLWSPIQWSVDTAARCLAICTLQRYHPASFSSLFTELCKTAELHEAMAFYRCTAVLQQSTELDILIGTGLRTHVSAIFEAISHNNPYPQLHLDENRWNHMVLKALFIDSTLWPIQGIDERANSELARILCDYAHERWAAHRSVTPELWRCVGPFATGSMLKDLHRALNESSALEQQAALLALHQCPAVNNAELRKNHPAWSAMIDERKLTWNSIGQALK